MLTINAEALTVYHAASDTSNNRFAMDGLHVDPAGLVATDGKHLALARWESPDFASFTISAPSVKRLQALVAARGSVVLDPERRTFDGEPFDLARGHFPPWQGVLPQGDLPEGYPLDANRLARVCKTLRAWEATGARWSTDASGTVLVSARDGDGCTITLSDPRLTAAPNACEVGFDPEVLAAQVRALGKRHRAQTCWPKDKRSPLLVAAQGYLGLVMPLDLA